jgi:hypothetical protein
VVRRGDTLFDLGRAYLRKTNDYRHVQRANQISRPRVMPVGKTLTIDADLLKTVPIDARLSAFSGKVEIETDGQRAPAHAGMTLKEGQRVITGPGAFATFELEDASRVTLPSNTAMRVVRLRSVVLTNAPQRVFKLDEGRSAIQATPNPNPNARFEVRTPVSISAVRGTEFRVATADGRARTEVLKGAVGVGFAQEGGQAPPPVGPPVPAGFGVTVTSDGTGVSAPVALLPAPKLNEADQNQTDKTVHFAVRAQDGAAAYRLLLSRDAGFIDLFNEATQAETAADFGRWTTAPISSASRPWTPPAWRARPPTTASTATWTCWSRAPRPRPSRTASIATSCSAGARRAAACAASASSCSPGPRRRRRSSTSRA